MKTSILISSIAALCLLITFAEAPHRYAEDKMDLASTDNISIVTTNRATMLPGVVIIPDRIKEAAITLPGIPAEEFSYLKFEVNEYMEADASNPEEADIIPEPKEADYSYLKFEVNDYLEAEAANPDEADIMPETTEVDFSYLKFNVSNYDSGSELNSDELAELPVNEFEYLRFDVNDYINSGIEENEIEVLPLEEGETTIEFSYLRFDVTKYYNSDGQDTDKQFELPEE